MNSQMNFGTTDSTVMKLQTIYDYANFYTSALKKVPGRSWNFKLIYLDAFAGAGRFELSGSETLPTFNLPMIEGVEDFTNVVEGSALRALKVNNPFDQYIFSDAKRSNVHELKGLKEEVPHLSDRIQITHEDANEVVKRFCTNMGNLDRAIIFLVSVSKLIE